jgi:hypothetical protein
MNNNIDIYYKKNNNSSIFNYLNKLEFTNIQNYIPIYNLFFELNNNNWNSINLNHKFHITDINSYNSINLFNIKSYDFSFNSFFKIVPIIDPIKYLTGKYKNISNHELFKLPQFNISTNDKKDNPFNASYVDSFFYYLSSQLLHKYNFLHAIDFYGSFLSIKNNFTFNIFDDLEYLENSKYFSDNCDIIYTIDNKYKNIIINQDTRKNRTSILLSNTLNNFNFDNINDIHEFDSIFIHNSNSNSNSNSIKSFHTNFSNNSNKLKIYKSNHSSFSNHSSINTSSTSSRTSISSRSSNDSIPDNASISSRSSNDSIPDTDSSISSRSSNDSIPDTDSSISSLDETLNINIKSFPVQIISIEHMQYTLDYLISNFELNEEELTSAMFQVIMILITYQKIFDFTHNDLHTNNIMYNETDEEYLYYCFNNKFYKVPTFGRLFKIIDFGRAIFKFNNKLICNDSYDLLDGDAATQYNFGPYYNKNKPRVEPNKSFDLCRLACSLYDHFIDEPDDLKLIKKDSIIDVIINWVNDDNNRNVLYKTNGKERYEGFKLYKMIARDVHKHTPQNQLKHPVFKQYIINKNLIKNNTFMNIDNYKSLI